MVLLIGFEPMAARVSGECSTKLSYKSMVEDDGVAPPESKTTALQAAPLLLRYNLPYC